MPAQVNGRSMALARRSGHRRPLARVIRQAVRTEIGWRRPGSVRQPSANPDSHARTALADRTRMRVIVSQSSR